MKNIKILIIAVMIVLSVLLSGCAEIKNTDQANGLYEAAPSAIEDQTEKNDENDRKEKAAPEPVALSLSWDEYLRESGTEEITINSVYEFASGLWKSKVPVVTDSNRVLDTYTREQKLEDSGEVRTIRNGEDGRVVIDPEKAEDNVSGIYWLFLATITECLGNSYLDAYSLYDISSLNRIPSLIIAVSFDYDDLGYENCAEQMKEERNLKPFESLSDEIKTDEGIYLFSMAEPLIYNYRKEVESIREQCRVYVVKQSHSENVFDSLLAGES